MRPFGASETGEISKYSVLIWVLIWLGISDNFIKVSDSALLGKKLFRSNTTPFKEFKCESSTREYITCLLVHYSRAPNSRTGSNNCTG